jgi:hypothetical protein
MAAKTMTHRKAYPCSEPIRDATVILPGPKTTEAMIKPGPRVFINTFSFFSIAFMNNLKNKNRKSNRKTFFLFIRNQMK